MNSKDLLIIAILTFFTVLVWIFFDAYHTYSNSTIPQDLKIQLEPLNVNISLSEIKNLNNRPEFFPITASLSAEISGSPSATPQ